MIEVGILQGIAEGFSEPTGEEEAFWDVQGYLKVDEMRAAVRAEDDIVALVRIEVNDASVVYLPEEFEQLVKEIVGEFFLVLF